MPFLSFMIFTHNFLYFFSFRSVPQHTSHPIRLPPPASARHLAPCCRNGWVEVIFYTVEQLQPPHRRTKPPFTSRSSKIFAQPISQNVRRVSKASTEYKKNGKDCGSTLEKRTHSEKSVTNTVMVVLVGDGGPRVDGPRENVYFVRLYIPYIYVYIESNTHSGNIQRLLRSFGSGTGTIFHSHSSKTTKIDINQSKI